MNDIEIRYGVFVTIAVWGLLAVVVGYLAGQRGRDRIGFAFIALCISPLLAFLVLIALPVKTPSESGKAKCPHCHGMVDPDVQCCMHCRRDIVWERIAPGSVEQPNATQMVATLRPVNGTIVDCHHCGKMFTHSKVSDPFAVCPHCQITQPVIGKKIADKNYQAECPDCTKTFPLRANQGIIETLCPHCDSILKLDTAVV
jgi:phage FluMu protein Com